MSAMAQIAARIEAAIEGGNEPQGLLVDDSESVIRCRPSVEDGAARVGGSVVHRHHLEIPQSLPRQAVEGGIEPLFGIANGEKDRDRGMFH